MADPWGGSWGNAWGASWKARAFVPVEPPVNPGGRITGGSFSRGRWRKLREELRAERPAPERRHVPSAPTPMRVREAIVEAARRARREAEDREAAERIAGIEASRLDLSRVEALQADAQRAAMARAAEEGARRLMEEAQRRAEYEQAIRDWVASAQPQAASVAAVMNQALAARQALLDEEEEAAAAALLLG